MEMKLGEKTQLAGSNIRFIVPATQAASRRMTISKPSLEMRVMYSEGWDEGIVVWRSRFNTGKNGCMADVRAERTYGDLDSSVALCSGTVGFRESCYIQIHESEVHKSQVGRLSPSARNPRRRQVLAPTNHFIRKFNLCPNCHLINKSIGTCSRPEIYRVNGLNMILVG